MFSTPGPQRVSCLALALVLIGACSAPGEQASSTTPPSTGPTQTTSSPAPTQTTQAPVRDVRFDADRALRAVHLLAGRIGPREATSDAFDRAATVVARRFESLGYDVSEPTFTVPAGVSWGVPVPEGRTRNVVAAPETLEQGDRYLLVGAHLDTVPQAPGAEDNASGVATLLELARVASHEQTRLPVVFVAFGAEEPRGEGDDWHHFGSRSFVSRMSGADRRSLATMVSLDRVGVGYAVPVCDGGVTDAAVAGDLRRAGRNADVPVTSCGVNQSSDHWSFERAGLPAARVGSTAYPQYHSAADRPPVVDRGQLRRVGMLMWKYLTQQ